MSTVTLPKPDRTERLAASWRARVDAEYVLLTTIVVGAAVIRFATLGVKSYWFDEGTTVLTLQGSLGSMFHTLRVSDTNPPLYYLIAWGWARVAGYGEFAVRSVSALAGVLTIPVSYLVGRRLFGVRAALIAAALLAVNPMLVWYSQEARSYALLTLFASLSLYFLFDVVERPRRRGLIAWAISCALMVATHYFGLFLVLAETAVMLWMLRRLIPRRGMIAIYALALVALVAVGVAADRQTTLFVKWTTGSGLAGRVVSIPGSFLAGFEANQRKLFAIVAGMCALIALMRLRRADVMTRHRARLLAVIAAVTILAPVLAAVLGRDYVTPRNMIAAIPPLAMIVGAGLAVRTARAWLAAGATVLLVGVGFAAVALTAWTPKYHYQDWRDVAKALGPARWPRAIVIAPNDGFPALSVYLGRPLNLITAYSPAVREVDVVGSVHLKPGQTTDPYPPVPGPNQLGPGFNFRLVELYRARRFTLVRYLSQAPALVMPQIGGTAAFVKSPAEVEIETPPGGH